MKRNILCVLASTLLAVSAAQANLLNNGSFEQPSLDGGKPFNAYVYPAQMAGSWTIEEGGITLVRGWRGSVADDGFQWLSLENNEQQPGGVISQTFDTEPGENYVLTFSYAGIALDRTWTLTYEVAGEERTVTIDTRGLSTTYLGPWKTETFRFTATKSTTTLTFKGDQVSGFHGPAIDKVSVAVAP